MPQIESGLYDLIADEEIRSVWKGSRLIMHNEV